MCKYLKKEISKQDYLGGESDLIVTYRCKLKMQSELKNLEVYQKLFGLGHEGSFVNDECPFATDGKDLEICHYFQK